MYNRRLVTSGDDGHVKFKRGISTELCNYFLEIYLFEKETWYIFPIKSDVVKYKPYLVHSKHYLVHGE